MQSVVCSGLAKVSSDQGYDSLHPLMIMIMMMMMMIMMMTMIKKWFNMFQNDDENKEKNREKQRFNAHIRSCANFSIKANQFKAMEGLQQHGMHHMLGIFGT